MSKEYLDLKMDFMFKQLFGHPSRKSITITFLNDLLHRTGQDRISDIQFENTELTKDTLDGKTSRLDLLVFTSTGERINVEIQLINQQDMPERVLYYWSRLFSSSLSAGKDYSTLTPTIIISILNYPLFPLETDNFHTIFHIKEDTEHFLWSPHLEIHAIDLSQFMIKWKKYRREMKENPPSELPWLMMLTAADYKQKKVDQEIFHELEEFSMNEQEICEAMIEWEKLSANEENKGLYEARMKFLRDQLSNIRGAHRTGKEEGKAEIIFTLKKKGYSIEEIAKLTDLKVEEIKKMLRL